MQRISAMMTHLDGQPVTLATYTVHERHIYGSSRLGMETSSVELIATSVLSPYWADASVFTTNADDRVYEMSNHLGNVLATFTGRKLPLTEADVVVGFAPHVTSLSDYYPFGSGMEGRTVTEGYRYGFNAMEREDELYAPGSAYDFGARMYDGRLGRWWSVDPLAGNYASNSSFCFVLNSPICAVDPDGEKVVFKVKGRDRRALKASIRRLRKSDIFRAVYKQLKRSDRVYNLGVVEGLNESESALGSFLGSYGSPASVVEPVSYEQDGEWVEGGEAQIIAEAQPISPGGGEIEIDRETLFSSGQGVTDSVVAEEIIHAYQYDAQSIEVLNLGPKPRSRETEFEAKGIVGLVFKETNRTIAKGSGFGYMGEKIEIALDSYERFLSGEITIQEGASDGLIGYDETPSDSSYQPVATQKLGLR